MWIGNFHTSIMKNDDQQITIIVHQGNTNIDLYITTIYANYTLVERKELWSSL